MSNDSAGAPRPLPDRPNLRHLKDQARDLLRAGKAKSLADAQFRIARLYGFASWPKLKAHVDALELSGQLKQAIDANDLDSVRDLMTHHPELHRAPLGYKKNGPLTWVAECRIPWEPPGPVRLTMAQWMIDNGSDVHQGGDGPLMRASLRGDRAPMMELLVANGADVNARWDGRFPIIFAPCETVQPVALKWLLDRGARHPGALDYAIGTYSRSPDLAQCIDLLLEAGTPTKYDLPGVLNMLRGRLDGLSDPELVNRRYAELDFGSTAYRRLRLSGATLLHVAAEYGLTDAARFLLDHGADVNARASVHGQTPVFHAVSQFDDYGIEVTRLLLDRGADVSLRVALPGHYEQPDETVECTPLGYALRFPGVEEGTVALLRERGAPE